MHVLRNQSSPNESYLLINPNKWMDDGRTVGERKSMKHETWQPVIARLLTSIQRKGLSHPMSFRVRSLYLNHVSLQVEMCTRNRCTKNLESEHLVRYLVHVPVHCTVVSPLADVVSMSASLAVGMENGKLGSDVIDDIITNK
jgi:hypothetical protein